MPFLRNDAVAGLHHCHTGDDYKDGRGLQAKNLAHRLRMMFGKERIVFGYAEAILEFSATPWQDDGDGVPEQEEIEEVYQPFGEVVWAAGG